MPGAPAEHDEVEVDVPEALRTWRGEAIDPCVRDAHPFHAWPSPTELAAERRVALAAWRDEHPADTLLVDLDALAVPALRDDATRRLADDPRRREGDLDLLRDTLVVLVAEATERHDADVEALADRLTDLARGDGLAWLIAGLARWSRPVPSPSARAAFAEAFRLAPSDPHTSLFHGWALATTLDGEETLRVLDLHLALAGPDATIARRRYRVAMRRDLLEPSRTSRRGAVTLRAASTIDPARTELVLDVVDGALVEAAALLGAPVRDELGVVVYETVGDLVSASCASDWAGGVYSGIVELTAEYDEEELRTVTRHETMHAALDSAARRLAPAWFEEGVAEYFERDDDARAAAMRHLAALERAIPIRSMTGRLGELSDDVSAALAYHQALGMILWLVELHGEGVISEGMAWLTATSPDPLFVALHGRPFDEAAFLAFARRYVERLPPTSR